MKKNRFLVFVDESNAAGTAAKMFRRSFDWLAFRNYLVAQAGEDYDLVEMVIYVGLPPATPEWADRRKAKLGYIHWLRGNGFLVVEKAGQPRPVGFKADVAVVMAIDAIDLTLRIKPDMVILVTGDADFAYLATTIRREGVEVRVASVQQVLSTELRSSANGFIDLATMFNSFPPLDGEGPAQPAETKEPEPTKHNKNGVRVLYDSWSHSTPA